MMNEPQLLLLLLLFLLFMYSLSVVFVVTLCNMLRILLIEGRLLIRRNMV